MPSETRSGIRILLLRATDAASRVQEAGVRNMTGQQPPSPLNGETVELSIPSIPESTADVDRIIDGMTERIGYDEGVRGDIMIAVNEVVKNAILHGNKCDAAKKVRITCTCNRDAFRIIVCDNGKGFDPAAVPDPLDPDNLLKESGRGLLILKTLMDEVGFEISRDGTKVTMVKYGHTA